MSGRAAWLLLAACCWLATPSLLGQTVGPLDKKPRPPWPPPGYEKADDPEKPAGERPVSSGPPVLADPGPPRMTRDPNAADRKPDQPFPEQGPIIEGGEIRAEDDPLPADPLHDDPRIARAMEVNRDFSLDLPDFVCVQTMERSKTFNLGRKWKPIDTVTADVVVLNGDDTYHNIQIDGEPFDGPIDQLPGIWSSGEYGALLWNLMSPETEADFRFEREDGIAGRPAFLFSFQVEQANSTWRLNVNSREHFPGYRGRVWLDQKSGRGLRIEMEATLLPYDYPVITAEVFLEYAEFEIDGKPYLLPSLAGNLSCMRGEARCFRNELRYSDYGKFEAASSVFTTNSTIDFGGEPPAEPTEESGP